MEEAEVFGWLAAMNAGRILAMGSPAELKERTATRDLDAAFIALRPAACSMFRISRTRNRLTVDAARHRSFGSGWHFMNATRSSSRRPESQALFGLWMAWDIVSLSALFALDSFAGGFMGYIASQPELNREVLKRAMFYGGVMGSFAVERFGTERDEAAFRALLQRHGPMVLGVCWRVLGDAHAVEDAFQATFLVLVRKASGVLHERALGSWLHTVATRVALQAREAAENGHRLFGFYGTDYGHLPFETADGNFDPSADLNGRTETYDEADTRALFSDDIEYRTTYPIRGPRSRLRSRGRARCAMIG